VRPAFGAAAKIVATWILWTALSAVIDDKMPVAAAPSDDDESVPVRPLGKLLPLLRNMLMNGLAVVAGSLRYRRSGSISARSLTV
jgi:hypothetical protein